MGLSLGFWEDTTSLCSQEIPNAVTLNTAGSGPPCGPDEYCVGIFDVGNLQASVTFTLSPSTFYFLLFTFSYSPPG